MPPFTLLDEGNHLANHERRIRYNNIPTIRFVSKKNPVRYLYASILPEIRLPADEARTRCGTCQKGTI